ncbi:MAG: bifunctional 5,10-methylene-tetrahydrofolate dehydrogenase/5,10-methylene-tetrahydrofolate cyclohydrolase [Firmicutes bacterium]|nr:bifunctional 5,10-methylene-tetrahydrofolate dehydrogenase/5,10-methylene-tetrahydrofolate cyclohydrolase [Bacillota bacterium]
MSTAKRLTGKPVADQMTAVNQEEAYRLRQRGIIPLLAIIRVGEDPGDISYEKGAVKRAQMTGVEIRHVRFDENVTQRELLEAIHSLNEDDKVDGILLLRPLPHHINEKYVCEQLSPAKDMDGITSGSMAGVFMDTDVGYPPCTAQACMDMLDYYGIDLEGKKVTIMGRSLVIGKPAAMMAMRRNATVTVLHSRTSREDFARAGQTADVVIAAMGRAKMVGEDQLGNDQVILDVGINVDEDGSLCGDIDYGTAEQSAAMITPVPGGVGSVTTAVLMKHVLQAASRRADARQV